MAYELAKAFVSISVDTNALKSGLSSALGVVKNTVFSMKTLIGTALGGFGVAAGTKWMLGLAADAEQSSIAFNVIIKDMEKTKKLLEELNTFSVVTPFEPTEVRQAGQTLVQLGVETKDVISTLNRLGDLASGAGGNFNELVLAWGKMRAQGRLMGEVDERFQTQGINLRMLIKNAGLLTGNYEKMREKGLLTFELVDKAIQKATSSGGMFAGAMIQQSTSLTGLWSTLKGNIDDFGRRIGEAIMPTFKKLATSSIEWMDGMRPKLEELSTLLEQKLIKIQTGIQTLFSFITKEWPNVLKAMKFYWDAFRDDFVRTSAKMAIQVMENIPGYRGLRDARGFAAIKAEERDVAAAKRRRDMFTTENPVSDAQREENAKLDAAVRLAERRLGFVKRFAEGGGLPKGGDWALGNKAQAELLAGLSKSWSELFAEAMKDATKPAATVPSMAPSFIDKMLQGLGGAMSRIPKANMPLFWEGNDLSDLKNKPRTGMSSFEGVNEAFQQAMLDQENPVHETNGLLKVNHQEVIRRSGEWAGQMIGKLNLLVEQTAGGVGRAAANFPLATE